MSRPAWPLWAVRCVRWAVVLVTAASALAFTAVPASGGTRSTPHYYVAIGGSETLGFQGSGPAGATRATSQGYTNDLLAMEAARWPGLQLEVFACPGVRVDMALTGHTTSPPGSMAAKTTSGRCSSATHSEVGTASAFIRGHRGQVVLVTVDLGYADVTACMTGKTIDPICVTDALARVGSALPMVVSHLRAAGGSPSRIVGLDHEDPYLAFYLSKPSPDSTVAEATAQLTERYNQVADAAYKSVSVRVAHIASAFDTTSVIPTHLPGWGTVPMNVERICSLTWMCAAGNIHPNAAGYRTIALAVANTLASSGRSR